MGNCMTQDMNKNTVIKLGYWGLRGRAQISRLLLAYTQSKWENIAYKDPNSWFGTDKQTLGLDFPNIPYLIDGDLKITESVAIERYVIEKSGFVQLLGKNLQDEGKVFEIVNVIIDIRTQLWGLIFDKDYQSKLKQKWEKLKPKIEAIQRFTGSKPYVLGYLTWVDFYIAENSYHFEKVYPDEYKKYPSFQRIRDNFNNLQQIKKYYGQQNAMKAPFMPPNMAQIKF